MSSQRKVHTEGELGNALKEDADRIEIEGDLAKKVIRIRATGKVAWAVCIACFAVAIVAIFLLGPTPDKAALVAPAAAILGLPAALTALLVGVSAGGVAALRRLRAYREVLRTPDTLVLERRAKA